MQLDDIYGMGLLTVGSCPGGGGSNVFAYMLNSDLELSIVMTFLSTLLALGKINTLCKDHTITLLYVYLGIN